MGLRNEKLSESSVSLISGIVGLSNRELVTVCAPNVEKLYMFSLESFFG